MARQCKTMEIAQDTLRTVVLAVDSFLGSSQSLSAAYPASLGRPPSLGASLLHMAYDPSDGWVHGTHATVNAIREKAKTAAVDAVRKSGENPETITYQYKELHIDLWTAVILCTMFAVVILFLIPRTITTTYTAILVVYLYAFAAYILSNGLLLHPYPKQRTFQQKAK